MHAATLAAHRFGYSETSLRAVQGDPRGWVIDQLKNPVAPDDHGLLGSAEAAALTREVLRAALVPAPAASMTADAQPKDGKDAPNADRQRLRRANLAALQRRWQHIVTTPTPVTERWVQFWTNHFCVAQTKGVMLGMVAPHEREAIRPQTFGRFVDLLRAATLHPSMLLYLDNAQSIGPNSRAGRRRERGLNENLARELLELHTLGVHGGYTQDDVTELARMLTGWTVSERTDWLARFEPALHEPGRKRVLGKTYREGPEAIDELFADLARHPSTARFVSTKLARHFVADEPPAALIDALAARFRASDGDLRAVAVALFEHPLAWRADGPAKLKRPEDWLLSAHRMLKLPVTTAPRMQAALVELGQPVGRAPSPQGWPDTTADWLAPDALWKRVEWSARLAEQHGALADARELAALSFGADLSAGTRREIERAESGAQALALLFASPEMLWR
jgi:uncharacterized protein (DUF1800 family)